MKNANTRFIRVLAMVLVVLMVVPAALVGCGSNKANNAAISEALAAAEAARKEAEEAKAAADAAAAEAAAKAAAEAQKALEEANKKAEEAIKAAEEAKKKAEEAEKQAAEAAKTTAAPTTTAPVTTAPVAEDAKEVAEYAYKVLNDDKLDFIKAMYIYYYGMTEEEIESEAYKATGYDWIPNAEYASDDLDAMAKLYGVAKLAITKATTVDYINSIVANFIAELAATPTYVERIIEKYEAIDFASNYDVIDVVKAYNYVVAATLSADAKKELAKYGEDEIDVLQEIKNEYYRYTGLATVDADKTVVEEDDVLYADMYAAVADVIRAVKALFGAANTDLEVAKIPYTADIDDLLEDATEAYAKWNTKYFVKAADTELVKYYEAFRQAFVGEEYIVDEDNDFAWEAVVAASVRVEELLAAVADAEALVKLIKNISTVNTAIDNADFKYQKYVSKVAEAKAALDAWKAKYNFKDIDEDTEDPNVKAIIDAKTEIYENYKDNALVIEYFAFLEKTASAVNVDAFIDASEEKLNDVAYNFNYKKYGSAVAAALEWYYGKEKTPGNFVGGFYNVKVADQKGFESLDDAYDVDALIAVGNVSIKTIFDDIFDVADVPALFDSMNDSYTNLANAKKAADKINASLDELVEMGETLKVLPTYNEIFKADFEEFDEADDDEKSAVLTADCKIKSWATLYSIVIGDDNFNNMIDWDAVETIYNNYRASLTSVVADAAKVALEYIQWQAAANGNKLVFDASTTVDTNDVDIYLYNEEDELITFPYNGKLYEFSDLEPARIDIYSYNRMLNIIELEKTLEDLFDSDNKEVVETLNALTADMNDDDGDLKIALTSIISYCGEMVAEFYTIAESGHSLAYNPKSAYPIIDPQTYKANDWRKTVADTKDGEVVTVSAADKLLEVALYGRTGDKYDNLKSAVKTVLGSFLVSSNVVYGDYKGTTANGIKIYTTSFQGAIYAVDPYTYATKDANGKVTGLDSAAYKAALNAKIESVYTTWFKAYLQDSDTQAKLTTLVNNIAKNHLNYGLWTIEGEFEIDDELYTYTVDTTGKAYVFTIFDSSDEKVDDITFKSNSVEYTVTFATSVADGKFVITPVLTAGTLPADTTIYELIDVKKADLVYDVRDYADEIGANYDKFTNKRFGSNSTLDKLTAAQLQAIFDAEAKNDFYVEFETLRARMYNKKSATNNAWDSLGTYIDSSINITAVKATIETHSKLARDAVYAMTPEANTIADIQKEFNKYATRVKAVLTEAGLVEGEHYYVNTLKAVTEGGTTTYVEVPEYISATKVERP